MSFGVDFKWVSKTIAFCTPHDAAPRVQYAFRCYGTIEYLLERLLIGFDDVHNFTWPILFGQSFEVKFLGFVAKESHYA